jgi:hypothetical protein
MICAELLTATSVLLALWDKPNLEQVILVAKPDLVGLTIKMLHLPWVVVREGEEFTVVRRAR